MALFCVEGEKGFYEKRINGIEIVKELKRCFKETNKARNLVGRIIMLFRELQFLNCLCNKNLYFKCNCIRYWISKKDIDVKENVLFKTNTTSAARGYRRASGIAYSYWRNSIGGDLCMKNPRLFLWPEGIRYEECSLENRIKEAALR